MPNLSALFTQSGLIPIPANSTSGNTDKGKQRKV